MALSQSKIDEAVNKVVALAGQRIAMPNGLYFGECTAPVCWYLDYLDLPYPSMANNRADGWGVSNPPALEPYFSFETFNSNRAYPHGTILMWNSPHIAIVLSDTGGDNGVVCFEQNADPDGSPCGIHTRQLNTATHTCTYAMVPIVDVPVQTSGPATFTVIENYPNGKQVKLNKQPTNLWGMNFHFDYMKDHPVEVHNAGEVWTVTNRVHHEDGYDYYRREDQVDGFNIFDCDDYTPPPPPPYVPPAAPVTAKPVTKLTLVTAVPTYADAAVADNRNLEKSNGTFPAGEYYLFPAPDTKMLNIGIANMDKGVWINPRDNVLPPEPEVVVPEPTPEPEPVVEPPTVADRPSEVPIGTEADDSWKASYKSFHDDRSNDVYELLNDYTMTDYNGKRPPVHMSAGKHINITGTFTKNGIKFYRPRDYKNDVTFTWFYGIPLFDDDNNPTMRKLVDETPQQHLADLWHLWKDDIKNYLGSKPVWDVVFKKHKRRK